MFSPNDRIIVTGTSLNKGEEFGKLVFFESDTFKIATEIEVTNAVNAASKILNKSAIFVNIS